MFQANAIFICNALQILGSGAFLQSEASFWESVSQPRIQTDLLGKGWGTDIDYEDCATQARVLDHFPSVSTAFSSCTSDFHVFNTISAKEGSSHWFSTHREQGSPERSNHSLWGPQLVINGWADLAFGPMAGPQWPIRGRAGKTEFSPANPGLLTPRPGLCPLAHTGISYPNIET